MNTMSIQIKRLVWYRRLIHSVIAVILGIAVLATDQAAFAWSYSATQGKAGGVALPKILLVISTCLMAKHNSLYMAIKGQPYIAARAIPVPRSLRSSIMWSNGTAQSG